MLPKLQRFYIDTVVETNLTDNVVDLIAHCSDLATRIGELPPRKLVSRRVGAAKWVLCASLEYLAEHGRPESPDDSALHNCVAFRSAESRQVLDHCDVILDAALSVGGIASLHGYIVEPHLRRGTIVRVLEGYSTPEQSILLLYSASTRIVIFDHC